MAFTHSAEYAVQLKCIFVKGLPQSFQKLLTCWMCLLWAGGGQTKHTLVLFKVGSVGVICWSFPPGIFPDIEPFAIRFEN